MLYGELGTQYRLHVMCAPVHTLWLMKVHSSISYILSDGMISDSKMNRNV